MKHHMFKRIRRSLAELRQSASGNTAILLAAGMPALIGSAGLAVDTAQWYMWKREMQNAVDQAAIAGAWSKVKGSAGIEYKTRAQQELTANLQIVDFQGTPSISLADYEQPAVKDDNSVVVTLAGSKTLPFTSIITNTGVTVSVRAQARFQQGRTFTACLIATDPSTKGAITIGGSAYVLAKCGAAALSTNPDAVVKNGSTAVFDVGWIVSAGGIDDAFNGDPGIQVFENQTGLIDPFGALVPPNNPTPQTYTCSPATSVYSATYTETTTGTDKKYEGSTSSNLALVSSTVASTGTVPGKILSPVDSKTKVGDTIVSSSGTAPGPTTTFQKTTTTTTGSGKNAVTTTTTATWYRRIDRVTGVNGVVTAVNTTTTPGGANLQPGTYSDFRVGCNTVMGPGVYVIDGGLFETHSSYSIRGDGVMIVLKNGAGIRINGNSNTYLRSMSYDEMRAAGISEAEAVKLKDMLIFEDRNSAGDDNNKINGTSGTTLGGTVYLPKSTLTFNGTADIAALHCLVIATKRIVIEGNTHMTSFCDGALENTVNVGGGATTVRLVS